MARVWRNESAGVGLSEVSVGENKRGVVGGEAAWTGGLC